MPSTTLDSRCGEFTASSVTLKAPWRSAYFFASSTRKEPAAESTVISRSESRPGVLVAEPRDGAVVSPATMISKSPSPGSTIIRIFLMETGKDFSRRLRSSMYLTAPFFESKSGLFSSRSLRESSPTHGMRSATTGSSGLIARVASSSSVKAARTSVKPGSRKSGLSMPKRRIDSS